MSEFDAFESAAPKEEDPAAEFLAREQNELGGLQDEVLGGVPAAVNSDEIAGMMEELDANPDVLQQFDSMIGGYEEPTQAPAEGDGFMFDGVSGETSTDDVPSQHEPSDSYAAISSVDQQMAEPEKIKIWREEQKVMLEEKDAKSEESKGKWREEARKELEDWYKHRKDVLEKSYKVNRETQESFLSERDEPTEGQPWEVIAKQCEFNPKNNKNQKDISRMRSILLQLKQTPLQR